MRAFVWPLFFLLCLGSGGFATPRDDYRVVDGALADGRIAFRAWSENGKPWLLTVEPETLVTSLVEADPGVLVPWLPAGATLDRLMDGARARRQGLQNAGVRRADPSRTGAWLTFDLCPSRHPLDRYVFTDLEQDGSPLPVMLEISGKWMATHPNDLEWLVGERDSGRLAITWVNHTENHEYIPGKPLGENFLLIPGTDLKAEIFGVENRLLDRGELPSVFFRFPGLVSTPGLVDRILALGLVPLGSSGWLAKEQTVKNGSLVLTHANGNEPEGLELLESWDHSHRPDIKTGHWHWLGLGDWDSARIPPP